MKVGVQTLFFLFHSYSQMLYVQLCQLSHLPCNDSLPTPHNPHHASLSLPIHLPLMMHIFPLLVPLPMHKINVSPKMLKSMRYLSPMSNYHQDEWTTYASMVGRVTFVEYNLIKNLCFGHGWVDNHKDFHQYFQDFQVSMKF